MNKIVFAGLGIIAAGLGFSFYKNYQLQANWKPPQRQKIAKLLIQLRQSMYPCLMEVTQVIQTQLKALNLQITPPQMIDQLKNIILSDQCPTGIKIKKVFKQIHRQISQEDMQKAITKFYFDDPQIQFHKKAFQQQFQKAFLGVQPQLKSQMPAFINKDNILNIVKTLLQNKIQRVKKQFQEKDKISQQFLQKDAQNDQKFRKKQMKKLKLRQTKNQISIFQFCVAKYLKMDQNFKKQYDSIVQSYRKQIKTYLKDQDKE